MTTKKSATEQKPATQKVATKIAKTPSSKARKPATANASATAPKTTNRNAATDSTTKAKKAAVEDAAIAPVTANAAAKRRTAPDVATPVAAKKPTKKAVAVAKPEKSPAGKSRAARKADKAAEAKAAGARSKAVSAAKGSKAPVAPPLTNAVPAPTRKSSGVKPKAHRKGSPATASPASNDIASPDQPVAASPLAKFKKVVADAFTSKKPPVTNAPIATPLSTKPAPAPVKASAPQVSAAPLVVPPNALLATVVGHADGFGFAKLDQGGDDLYLSEDCMRAVLHGDRVAVRASGFNRDGKANGEVVSVLQRANHRVVGKLRSKEGQWFVVASERRINQDILIPRDKLGAATLNQIVVAEITSQPTPYDEATGAVIEVVGDENSSNIELEIAIRKHNLPYVFTDATLKEAASYGDAVTDADRKGRKDLREMALVTIDGETAKDFDDAVYAEKSGKGFRLVVAIADVSHYVKLKTALDTDARERTTSVYFPRRVIPMLPEALSNELCSLRPKVDRLCMVCDMQVTANGVITGHTFYAAVMNSKARLTYTEVAALLPALETAKPKAGTIDASLKTLHALYKIFRDARTLRGALDFEGQEAIFSFNDDGSVAGIKPAVRNDAHKLIEEMMLAANVCTAEFLNAAKQPLLYRVHDIPLPAKLAALRETLSLRGLTLGGGDRPEPTDYANLIEETRDRIDAPALHTVMLRSLPQAIYTPANGGHFGLAYEHYAHFTSPIRRYPDLLAHRGIKAVLAGKLYKSEDWTRLGEICSANERRADIASREVTQFLKAKYLEAHIGEDFNGTVSGVLAFGAFVTLDETFADGLIHATTLPRDYYQLGRDKVTLEGQRSGFKLGLGERVRVKIAAVNADTAKVDFQFVEKLADRG
ncbi:MAG: ribonuclease R [Casimicrobium sp.]